MEKRKSLCGLRNLQELDIKLNGFWGPLPSCFYNMTSLCALDLQENNFSGVIPSSLFYNLKSLAYINLSRNAFEGSLSLASLANTSNLEVFSLLNNRHRLEHDLRYVQLGHNGMTGYFPNWLLDNNVNLERLTLTGNNLSGDFNLPSNLNLDNMEWFDVSANIIEGELPSWIGSIFLNLHHLNLSKNLLEGRIPSSMGNMNQLHTLDLANNGFKGEIPEPLAKNCTSLFLLKLSGNHLQGEMLPMCSSLTSLRYLYLENNHFIGTISPGMLNSSLLVLDVSNNSLFGTLPNWIGDIEDLKMLMLSSNLFRSPLPLSFCNLHYLKLLDLSGNNLGPNILHCANATVMRFLHLTNDKLARHFPDFLSRASLIVTLDLRHNALSSKVPGWINSLWNLKVLLLQGNSFEGSIPLDLCLLKNMSILDLSNNNLFGKIPSCLKDLAFGNNGVSTNVFDTFSDSQQIVVPNVYISRFSVFFSYYEDKRSTYTYRLEEVYFMAKSRLESYEGHILQLMLGIDLSQNNLTGFIPQESVESLDLSYNSLISPIPPQLIELYTLLDFRVAHNNLSGRTPDRKNQFGTFGETSYENNPLLCGTPLPSCDDSNWERVTLPSFNHTKEDDPWREAFLWSFAGSYVVAFLGVFLSRARSIITSYLREMPDRISLLWNLKRLPPKLNHFDGLVIMALCQMTKMSMILTLRGKAIEDRTRATKELDLGKRLDREICSCRPILGTNRSRFADRNNGTTGDSVYCYRTRERPYVDP
ncbi:hypothetical protein BT93_L2079 [Corymbia citriodora subsp. variegata]|uniref:Uncharacterized protein n=1 Tax=Corymbia citriodora subsp. variegata TaxID=360336 RepID=A0A8T0CR29_CORYI|nr:hypothetical protein BT93_L2079 [Corymbia citriodora subsp. variegata]